MSQQYPPDNGGQLWNNPQPPQPPYYPPGYMPVVPPQQTHYSQLGQFPQQPPKKKRKGVREMWNSGTGGKCGILFACGVLLLTFFVCIGTINAANGTGSPVATPTPVAQNVPVATAIPTTKPIPTAKPKPTATPLPQPSASQLEVTYKASTTDTTVATLDKDGNADNGNDEHFTSTIIGFVKDSGGNTAGANVSDADTNSVVQVEFTPGTDVTQLNQGDTLEVWGTNLGVSTGTNAFGGTVQEVVIQANYLTDITTGYKADS